MVLFGKGFFFLFCWIDLFSVLFFVVCVVFWNWGKGLSVFELCIGCIFWGFGSGTLGFESKEVVSDGLDFGFKCEGEFRNCKWLCICWNRFFIWWLVVCDSRVFFFHGLCEVNVWHVSVSCVNKDQSDYFYFGDDGDHFCTHTCNFSSVLLTWDWWDSLAEFWAILLSWLWFFSIKSILWSLFQFEWNKLIERGSRFSLVRFISLYLVSCICY